MTSALLLAGWIVSGVALAGVFAHETESRWAWAPMAVVFGPLWYLIARDQRPSDNGRVPGTDS